MHTLLLGNQQRMVVAAESNPISAGLAGLIEANEPYWGGEAEVIRSYWDSPIRNQETDRKWLIHQIYKEYWDGILPPLESLTAQLPHADVRDGRAKLLNVAEILFEEAQHFSLFADLYLVLEGVDYSLAPDELRNQGAWPENDDLMELRRQHKAQAQELGQRAYHFTEGGHCALFTEGMKIAGRSPFDDAVADVCRQIYADEFNHMLLGVIGADAANLSHADWTTLTENTVAQMKKRILMRNAQFSRPVPEARLCELLAGNAEPVKFNFTQAARLMQQST